MQSLEPAPPFNMETVNTLFVIFQILQIMECLLQIGVNVTSKKMNEGNWETADQ